MTSDASAPIDRLIVHIGTFKTGTSSIQQFLGANVDALRKAGICYPLAGRRPGANVPGHHRLSSATGRAVSDRTEFDEIASQVHEEYAQSGCDTLFISSEEFSSIHRPDLLFDAFPAKRVEIVASFRPQYEIATALYFTAVIGDRVTAFPEQYLEKTLRPFFLNYRDTLLRWRSARPDATIHIRRFEKGTPARTDAVADLVSVLGMPLSTERPEEDFRIHQTLPARGTLALRALATLNCGRQELGVVLRLMRLHPELQGTEMSVFPPSRRREIHEEYRESNRDLRKQFVDGVDADFFDEPQLGDDADWHAAVGDEATIVRDVLVGFAKHALRLERLNEARMERQREERLTRAARNATT